MRVHNFTAMYRFTVLILLSLSVFSVKSQTTIDFSNAYASTSQLTPGILEAWSYTQTRFQEIHEGMNTGCSGIPLPYGVMGVFENGASYFRENALLISHLSGISIEAQKNSTDLQVLAFAKAYEAIMAEVILENGGSSISSKNIYNCILTLSELPDSGIVNHYAKDLQAYEIFNFLNSKSFAQQYNFPAQVYDLSLIFGTNLEILRAQKVQLTANGISSKTASYQQKAEKSTQYGPAIWEAAPSCNFSSRSGTAVSAITIHTIQGSYFGAISWSQNCTSNVSFHYVIRSSDGQVTQMVSEQDKAWHVGSENPYTIGYEHEGYVNNPVVHTSDVQQFSRSEPGHREQWLWHSCIAHLLWCFQCRNTITRRVY